MLKLPTAVSTFPMPELQTHLSAQPRQRYSTSRHKAGLTATIQPTVTPIAGKAVHGLQIPPEVPTGALSY